MEATASPIGKRRAAGPSSWTGRHGARLRTAEAAWEDFGFPD